MNKHHVLQIAKYCIETFFCTTPELSHATNRFQQVFVFLQRHLFSFVYKFSKLAHFWCSSSHPVPMDETPQIRSVKGVDLCIDQQVQFSSSSSSSEDTSVVLSGDATGRAFGLKHISLANSGSRSAGLPAATAAPDVAVHVGVL